MLISALTSGLPSALPDLFRRTDAAPARSDASAASGNAADTTGADDQRWSASVRRAAHASSPAIVSTRMPSASGVEQARTRSPLSSRTQQSWQAAI